MLEAGNISSQPLHEWDEAAGQKVAGQEIAGLELAGKGRARGARRRVIGLLVGAAVALGMIYLLLWVGVSASAGGGCGGG
jgi:hypothetical protein